MSKAAKYTAFAVLLVLGIAFFGGGFASDLLGLEERALPFAEESE